MFGRNKVQEITPAIDRIAFPDSKRKPDQEKADIKTKALKAISSVTDLALRAKGSRSTLTSLDPDPEGSTGVKSVKAKTSSTSMRKASIERNTDKALKSKSSTPDLGAQTPTRSMGEIFRLNPSTPDLNIRTPKRSLSKTPRSETAAAERDVQSPTQGLARSLRRRVSNFHLRSQVSIPSSLPFNSPSKSNKSKCSTPDLRLRGLGSASSIKSKAPTPESTRKRSTSNAAGKKAHRTIRAKISIPNILATVTDPSLPSNFKNVCLSKKGGTPTLADLKRQGSVDDAVWHFNVDGLQKIHERAFLVYDCYLRLLAVLEMKNSLPLIEAKRTHDYNTALQDCHSDQLVQQYNIMSEGLAIHQKATSRAAAMFGEIREKASDSYLAANALEDDEDFRQLVLGLAVDLLGYLKGDSLRDVLEYYEESRTGSRSGAASGSAREADGTVAEEEIGIALEMSAGEQRQTEYLAATEGENGLESQSDDPSGHTSIEI